MKYIPLARSVERCRPQPPLSKLHNDCGMQDRCARYLAANIHGDRTQDFSLGATPYALAMLCNRFVSIASAAEYSDGPAEPKPMQSPT